MVVVFSFSLSYSLDALRLSLPCRNLTHRHMSIILLSKRIGVFRNHSKSYHEMDLDLLVNSLHQLLMTWSFLPRAETCKICMNRI